MAYNRSKVINQGYPPLKVNNPAGVRSQIFFYYLKFIMVEPLLSGIVLGLIGVTIPGLFVTAYLQYRRGDLASF